MPLLTPHVPSGLIDLMKDLAKEVLRDKPENIYEFAVVHFEKLILKRDGSLDKGYEEFSAFEDYFDGQQRFAVPSNCGYICQKPIKIQPIPQPRKSKSDIMASFQAMESINEEDVLAAAPALAPASPYADEKYQNAIYVIQRYFRNYMARKENPPNTNINTNTDTKAKSLSAFTAAIIIQRTMRRLFSNKIKLKNKDKDSGPSIANAVKLAQDDMDNVSEAASYTSSSTIQMLADGQEGRENRLASGQSRRQREEVLDGYGDGDGGGYAGAGGGGGGGGGGVIGAADLSSMEFKEPTQDEEPPSASSSSTATSTAVVADEDDDEEHSHSVVAVAVAVTEMDRKSIADENGNSAPIPEEKPHLTSATTTDDTSTAHNIGILSTEIGSNYNYQNLPTTNNNHIEIDRNRRQPIQINASQLSIIIPAGLSVPLNYPQSLMLGTTPDTLPSATSPHLKEETQETFQVHHLEDYANENGKNNDASSLYQVDGRIRKFDSDTGESLKIYDVYYQDMNDQEFSDSLNESIMEKDSLEPEELDADSLESNENVVHHMSDIVKRDARQDDGSLYGDKNDDEVAEGEGDQEDNDDAQNVQKFIEIERVPTYLYGIHPARTPVAERRNRSRNSEESHKVPEDKKYLEAAAAAGSEVDSRSPDDKSEEESLESKGSTSEESSATQIENNLELRVIQTKASTLKVQTDEDEEEPTKYTGITNKLLNDEHSISSIAQGQLMHQNETNHPTPEIENSHDLTLKGSSEREISLGINLKPNDSQRSMEKLPDSGEEQNETNLSRHKTENHTSKNHDTKLEEENQKNGKDDQKSNDFSPSKLNENSALEEEKTNLVLESMILKQINTGSKSNDLDKENLKENTLQTSIKTASEKLIDSERVVEDTASKLEETSFQQENDNLNSSSVDNSSVADIALREKELISRQAHQPQCDVQKHEDKLPIIPSKDEDDNTSPMSKTFNDQAKVRTYSEKSSSSKDTHSPLDNVKMIEPVDRSKNLIYGEDSVKQKSEDKLQKSEINLAERNQNESSLNLSKGDSEVISNISENPKPDQNLNSETSEDGKKEISNHDQEIESQLKELQNLNDLLPGLNIEDHLGNTRSEDGTNHKISQHDDNNNLEGSSYQNKDIHLNMLSTSGKQQDSEESVIEKDEKPPEDKNPSKGLMHAEKILATSKVIEDRKSTFNASESSEILELSEETNKTSTEGKIKMPKEDILGKELRESQSIGGGNSFEYLQQISEPKNTFSDSKSEDDTELEPEKVSNDEKEEVKIGATGSDSLKNGHISDSFAEPNVLPSTSGEATKHLTESEDNLENIDISNGQNENSLILDHKEPGVESDSLASAVKLTSSKINLSNDSHDSTLEKDGFKAQEDKIDTKEKTLIENKIDIEDKLDNEATKKYEDNEDKTKKQLDTDKNAHPSLLEDKAVEEMKDEIPAESNGSNSAREDKDETIELFDSKELHTLENSTCLDDQRVNLDKSNQSSNDCLAKNVKTEEESIEPFDSSTDPERKEDARNITIKTEKPQNIIFIESSKSTEQKEDQSNLNVQQSKSITTENIQDSDIGKSQNLKEANQDNTKFSDNPDAADNMISSMERSDEEPKGLKNQNLNKEIVSEKKNATEEKKSTEEELSLETRAAETSSNNKSDQESKEISEKAVKDSSYSNGSEKKINTASENPHQKVVASNENISAKLTPSKKADHDDSTTTASTDIEGYNSSAETSADVSSIGKDLEFFEDTIKYLKNATEHLGGMEDMFDANKNSIDVSKDADVLNHSAVLIQSAFRGYQVRKDLNKSRKSEEDRSRNKSSLGTKKIDSDSNDENKVNAAIKIQSAYRGHRVRRDLRGKLNEGQTEIQVPGNVPSSSQEDNTSIQSPSKNMLGSNNLVRSQIPVAVIHPTKYLSSMEEGQSEKVSEARATTNSKSISSSERNESSPSKQLKSSQSTSVKVNHKNVKSSPHKTTFSTRQQSLEKKPNVKNDSSDEFKEEPSIPHKRSIEKNDQTFIRDTLDQTVKLDKTQILGNRKLTKTNNSNGNGNKSKNLNTKTLSTADLLERPKGSKNVRDQFERKGKSVSINGRAAKNQESFDLETIKKELLSTTFTSPPQSGSKKKTGARVKSGKQRSPVKPSKGTKIPQKSPSKIANGKQTKQDELQSSAANTELEKPASSIKDNSNKYESDLSKTFTKEMDQEKNPDLNLDSDKQATNNNIKKPTLSKTYTVRSSLNEVENLSPQLETHENRSENSSEDLFDSLKKDMDKLKANVHEKSAVTIQKTFRGYKTRKNLNKSFKSSTAFDNTNLRTASVTPENAIESSSKKGKQSSVENQETHPGGIVKEIKMVKGDNPVEETEKESSMLIIGKLHNPALDRAATKIQKTYRGYKIRKNYKISDENGNKVDSNQDTEGKTTNNLGVESEKVFNERKLQQDGELSNEESTNKSLEKSALTIQKTFRGYQSRKEVKLMTNSKVHKKDPNIIKSDARSNGQTDSLNLDSKLNPEESAESSGIFEDLQKSFEGYKNLVLDKSATTIQKHFRGYKTRKDINTKGVRSGIATDIHVFDMKAQGNGEQNEAEGKSVGHQNVVEKSDINKEGEIPEKGESEEPTINLNKSETGPILPESGTVGLCKSTDLDKSATTIQKHFRGYKTKKDLNIKGVRSGIAKDPDVSDMRAQENEEQIEPKGKKLDSVTTINIKEEGDKQVNDFNKSETAPILTEGEFKEKSNTVGQNRSTDLEKSATTIQKHFRGYQTRKDLNTKGVRSGIAKDIHVFGSKTQRNEEQNEVEDISIVHQHVVEKKETKKEGGKQETVESGINDLNKSVYKVQTEPTLSEGEFKEKAKVDVQCNTTDLQKSATTIQKNFRGYRARKNLKRETMIIDRDLKQKILLVKKDSEKIDDELIKKYNQDVKKQGVFDSFDVEEFHNEALQESATTIQKTFRGYKTRKELLSKKFSTKARESNSKSDEIERNILNPALNEKLIQGPTVDHAQANNSNKKPIKGMRQAEKEENLEKTTTEDHIQSTGIKQAEKEQNLEKTIKSGILGLVKQPTEDHAQASGMRQAEVEQNLEKTTETGNLDLVKKPAEDQTSTSIHSNNPIRATNSFSAEAVLENAASTIQKAYRDYHANKSNLSSRSYPNGTHRETTPKEVLENSDESSTFIGRDTSFDLSDVESVETKSEKAFLNYDKINSSEAHTPTDNSEESLVPTLSLNGVHFEDREIDNECVRSPQKLRLKRSLIEPTAPPLDEILNAVEPVSASPKLKWFVGDDPIIPSDSDNSSKSSSPASSSSVDPLISTSTYSKFNDLSSIDACRENLNSNQQLTPSISSAVVSTSSLLLTNITEINDKNPLNKNNSGIVSANEEEILKQNDNNLEKIDQSEEISNKLVNEDETALSVVESNKKLSNGSQPRDTEENPQKKREDKQDDTKKFATTDVCKNCAEGIHEGGVCAEDLIKFAKSDQTEFDSSDQIKQFVLMEEQNHAQSSCGITESSVISSQKEEKPSTVASVDSSNATVTVSDATSQGHPTEQLKSSNDCPAISLIPPSSEDDASERESSPEVSAKHVDDGFKNQKDKSEDIIKTAMQDKGDTEMSLEKLKEKEDLETEAETERIDAAAIKETNIKQNEDVSGKSMNAELIVDSKEDKDTSSEEETAGKIKKADKSATETMEDSQPEEILDDHLTETNRIENSNKDNKSENFSNEIEETDHSLSKLKEPLEDAFKMRPGEESKIEQHGFEDDFSDNKDIPETSEAHQISTELDGKTLPMEDSKVKKEESLETETNEATSKNLVNEKPFEGNNGVLDENSSKAKGLESKITQETVSHELMEEIKKSSDRKNIEDTAAEKESLDNKPDNLYKALQNSAEEDTKLEESSASNTTEHITYIDSKTDPQTVEQKEDIKKESHQQETEKGEPAIKQVSKALHDVASSLEDAFSTKGKDGIVQSEVSMEKVEGTDNAIETKEDENSLALEWHEDKQHDQNQEDIEIAAKLIESSLSDPQAKLLENENKTKLDNKEISTTNNEIHKSSKIAEEQHCEDNDEQETSQVEAKIEKLIEDNLKPVENIKNTVDPKDLPTGNSSQEIVEEPCVKKVVPPIPYSAASSDPDESELESTTTKAGSPSTTPGYDETSETDALDIPPSKPDVLDAMTEKLREPEEMVARMRQRRASEHKISIDSVTSDQQAVFEEPVREPIKPMQKIQKSSSTEAEDEFVLQKLQRGDTTRESSAQSESVVYGDSTSQLTESEDTFNENLDLHSLHRMNTIAANRGTLKPQNHFSKSVTIDDTVKYIDPEKSTEESGSSFCMDDALSEDVRKKMMAYSVSEADSDYYEVGDQTNHPHDDFNISTALDNFPSTDTDTTIVSAAATKIQAGARGFLTRRRIRRASMGTKASLTEERNLSFGNDAIGESLDQLAEEENGRRQFNRQTGVNSLPSALEHSDEMLSPRLGEETPIATITTSAKHSSIKIEAEKDNKKAITSSENDVNDWLEKSEDDSSQIVSNLEATVARRLTLQRGDAMRNDSTPDDENGNGKQVDLAKNNPSSMGAVLVHEKTMVESTTTTTTRTTTERRNYSDAAVSNKKEKIKWFALRQNSMPVQIDSEIFRVLPKHMRKRIKSAEGEKPKRIRLPRD